MLALILPVIRGIYGEFWAVTFDAIISRGLRSNRDESLFSIHSSLRLLWLLRKPEALEANDDLLDAWNERKGGIWRALLGLLVQLGGEARIAFSKSSLTDAIYFKIRPMDRTSQGESSTNCSVGY